MVVTLTATAVTTGGQVRTTLQVTGDPGTLTITRTVAGVTVPVRGAENVTPTLPVTYTDWEVPVGSASYTVTSTAGTNTKVVSLPAPSCLWLVPIVDAATKSLRVDVESHTDFGPGMFTDVFQPLGGGPATVVSSDLTAETGRVTFKTQNATDYASLMSLMGKPLWVSHDPTHGFGPFYVVLQPGATSRTVPLAANAQRRVPATYVVQQRPAITTSGRVTWLDVASRYPTWQALATRYGTWQAFLDDAATWNS